jgi:hypothetical protein
VLDLLQETDELGCKPACKDESAKVDKIQYQRLWV